MRALVEGRFENFVREFLLAGFIDIPGADPPHVGDENDVLQCQFTAEFAEHVKTPPNDPIELVVGYTVDVDDPGKGRPFLMPVEKFSPSDGRTANADACLHGG